MTPASAWLSVAASLVLAALLTSGRVLTIAQRLPVGDSRDRWVPLAEDLNGAAGWVWLDKPSQWAHSTNQTPEPESFEASIDSTTLPTASPSVNPTISRTASAQRSETTTTELASATTTATTTTATTTTTTATTTTSAAATTLVPVRSLSPDDPLVVWVGGDSLGEYIGQELAGDYSRSDSIDTFLDYQISTGLTRPDYFDWTFQIADMIKTNRPDIMIFMVGGNDNQPMAVRDGYVKTATPEWGDEYYERARIIMNLAVDEQIQFVWVLLPPVVDPTRSEIHSAINGAIIRAADERPLVSVYDPGPLLTAPDGSIDRYVVGPNGDRELARAADGLHMTRRASSWMAEEIWDELLEVWGEALSISGP